MNSSVALTINGSALVKPKDSTNVASFKTSITLSAGICANLSSAIDDELNAAATDLLGGVTGVAGEAAADGPREDKAGVRGESASVVDVV